MRKPLLLLACCLQLNAWSQSTGDFRSAGNVDLNAATNWELFNGTAWTAASIAPNGNVQSGNTVTILDPHNWSNQLSPAAVIPAGATLVHQGNTATFSVAQNKKIQLNGTYVHNTTSSAADVIDGMSLNSGSTVTYRGSSSLNPKRSLAGRTFYNLSFESTSGTLSTTIGVTGNPAQPLVVTNVLSIGANVKLSQGSFAGSLGFNGDILLRGQLSCNSFTVAAGKTLTDFNTGASGLSAAAAGQTFTVNGRFITSNPNGLCFTANASISGTNAPAVVLGPASQVLYQAAAGQTVSGPLVYQDLSCSGGNKLLGGDVTVNGIASLNNTVLALDRYELKLAGDYQAINGKLSGTEQSGLTVSSSLTALTSDLDFAAAGNSLRDFSITGNCRVRIGVAGMQIFRQLNIASGTLDMQHHLLSLRSVAAQTSWVAPVTGTLLQADQVQIGRYLHDPAGATNDGRNWRLLTVPLRAASPAMLYDHWQNGGSVNGYGIEAWMPGGGPGLSAGGNGASIRSYERSTNSFKAVTSTMSEPLFDTGAPKAFYIFTAGPFGSGAAAGGHSATELRATGSLRTGDQQTAFEYANGRSLALVGNPYFCAVDFDKVLAHSVNLLPQFWALDPALGRNGGYVLVKYNSVSQSYDVSPPASSQNRFIQNGQAVFVKAAVPGPAQVHFKESDKESTQAANQLAVMRQHPVSQLTTLKLALLSETDTAGVLDECLVHFHPGYHPEFLDEEDGVHFRNPGESIATRIGSRELAIDARPWPVAADTLQIGLGNVRSGSFRLGVQLRGDLPAGQNIFLQDHYLGLQFPMTGDSLMHRFRADPVDSASVSKSRFSLLVRWTDPAANHPALDSNKLSELAVREPAPTQSSVRLVPNPCRPGGRVTIAGPSGIFDCRVIDGAGRTVWQGAVAGNNFILPEGAAKPGVYSVQLLGRNAAAVIAHAQLVVIE